MARGQIKMSRGDTTVFTVTAVDVNGAALPLTGGVIWFTGKASAEDTDAEAVFQHYSPDHGIVLTDATNGIATITMAAIDTSGLDGDTTLEYDVQLVDSLGGVQTLARGQLKVISDITQNVEVV